MKINWKIREIKSDPLYEKSRANHFSTKGIIKTAGKLEQSTGNSNNKSELTNNPHNRKVEVSHGKAPMKAFLKYEVEPFQLFMSTEAVSQS